MKIAVTAAGDQLSSDVVPRFGRCKYFIIVDTDSMAFEAVLNTPGAGGAGIAAGELVAAHGVKAVLTGDCGPNAFQVLSAAGIEVITGVSGKVQDVVEDYKSGKLKSISQPSVQPHHGQASS